MSEPKALTKARIDFYENCLSGEVPLRSGVSRLELIDEFLLAVRARDGAIKEKDAEIAELDLTVFDLNEQIKGFKAQKEGGVRALSKAMGELRERDVEIDDQEVHGSAGSFTTQPRTPAAFTIAAAACRRFGSIFSICRS